MVSEELNSERIDEEMEIRDLPADISGKVKNPQAQYYISGVFARDLWGEELHYVCKHIVLYLMDGVAKKLGMVNRN